MRARAQEQGTATHPADASQFATSVSTARVAVVHDTWVGRALSRKPRFGEVGGDGRIPCRRSKRDSCLGRVVGGGAPMGAQPILGEALRVSRLAPSPAPARPVRASSGPDARQAGGTWHTSRVPATAPRGRRALWEAEIRRPSADRKPTSGHIGDMVLICYMPRKRESPLSPGPSEWAVEGSNLRPWD